MTNWIRQQVTDTTKQLCARERPKFRITVKRYGVSSFWHVAKFIADFDIVSLLSSFSKNYEKLIVCNIDRHFFNWVDLLQDGSV